MSTTNAATTTPHPATMSTTTPRVTYIQRKDGRMLETVDEFSTRREARAMLAEYRMSDPTARHYLSTRPCKGWNS
jgi:hypothetical protein